MLHIETLKPCYSVINVKLFLLEFVTSLNGLFHTLFDLPKVCIRFWVVPGLSIFADDSTVQQAEENAAHQDVRLTLSQLANDREHLSAWCSIPEKHTQPCKHSWQQNKLIQGYTKTRTLFENTELKIQSQYMHLPISVWCETEELAQSFNSGLW